MNEVIEYTDAYVRQLVKYIMKMYKIDIETMKKMAHFYDGELELFLDEKLSMKDLKRSKVDLMIQIVESLSPTNIIPANDSLVDFIIGLQDLFTISYETLSILSDIDEAVLKNYVETRSGLTDTQKFNLCMKIMKLHYISKFNDYENIPFMFQIYFNKIENHI